MTEDAREAEIQAAFREQFAAMKALRDFARANRPSGPPSPDIAGALIMATYARGSKTFQASFRLALKGYGAQAGMLNRSLFEDMIVAHWIRLQSSISPSAPITVHMARSWFVVGVKIVVAWLPIVGIVVALGVAFGWRVAVAAVVAFALFLLRLHTEPRAPGRLRTIVEFVVFAVIGTALGAFALGALGGIFGCMVGIAARLAEVPITGLHPWGRRRS